MPLAAARRRACDRSSRSHRRPCAATPRSQTAGQRIAGGSLVALAIDVAQPELERVDAEVVGDQVDLRFDGEVRPSARPARGTSRSVPCWCRRRSSPRSKCGVRYGPARICRRDRRRRRAGIGEGAAVEEHPALRAPAAGRPCHAGLERDHGAAGADRRRSAPPRWSSSASTGRLDLRASSAAKCSTPTRSLPPKPPPMPGTTTRTLLAGRSSDLGQHVLHVEGKLGVGPDADIAVAVPVGDGRARLGVARMHVLRREAMLVDAIGTPRSPPRRRRRRSRAAGHVALAVERSAAPA